MSKTPVLGFFAILIALASLTFVFAYAPVEIEMREAQKIFYFHVGAAWTMFIALGVTAVGGVVCLIKGSARADALAGASAEIGWLYASIVLLTGMCWARSAWNVWWNWEPRLTSMLVLWLIYAGYLLFRASTRGEQRRRYSSVYGVVAFVTVPLVYYSINIWGSLLHPPTSTKMNLEAPMVFGMFLGFASMALVYLSMASARARLELAERELDALRYEEG